MGVIEPDITSLLLLKAGDVERNPGPSTISPEDEVCEISSQGNEVCGKCKNKLKSNAKRIRCTVCQNNFHKTTCTDELRSVIDKVDRESLEWTCKGCRQTPTDTAVQLQPHVVPHATQGRQMCGKCNKPMRKALPVTCNQCKLPYHKTTCTDESRDYINKVVKENKKWICKRCKPLQAEAQQPQLEAQPTQTDVQSDAQKTQPDEQLSQHDESSIDRGAKEQVQVVETQQTPPAQPGERIKTLQAQDAPVQPHDHQRKECRECLVEFARKKQTRQVRLLPAILPQNNLYRQIKMGNGQNTGG